MRVTNRFVRGFAVYKCEMCGRSTRQTGRGDNEWVNLCAECYDLAGMENHISDHYASPEEATPQDRKEINRLWDAIVKKGGKPSFEYMTLIVRKGEGQ